MTISIHSKTTTNQLLVILYFITCTRLREVRWSVCKLMEVARTLKSRRTTGGALELEGSEVTIQMDKSKDEITNLLPKQVQLSLESVFKCSPSL